MAVTLGTSQVGLQDGAQAGELLAQFGHDRQGGVGCGVVFGVDGDPGAGLLGGRADLVGVVGGDFVSVTGQELPERRQLE